MSKESSFDTTIMRRVLSYLRPYKGAFSSALVLTVLTGILAPLRAPIIGNMVQAYVQNDSNRLSRWTDANYTTSPEKALLFWTVVVIVLLFIEGLVQFLRTYLSAWLGQSVIRDLRVLLFRRISAFKLSYYDNTAIGALVTRVVSDIEAVSDIFSQGILTILGDLLKILVIVIIMLTVNWQLGLLCLIPLPLMIIATRLFARAMKKAFQQERIQVNKLNTFVQERLTGMNIIQIFNRETVEMKKFEKINEDHKKAHINAVWAFSIFLPVVEFFSSLSIAILIAFSLTSIESPLEIGATLSEIITFILLIGMLYRPLRQLADRFNVLQRGVVRAERVFKVMDEDEFISDDGIEVINDLKGALEFRDIHFAYTDDEYVIKGISFKVEPGETIAFVGSTGAGKSTLINLLSRFYEYQKGEIFIDGKNIKSYKLNSIRQHISLVPQDVFLFSDTIYNNITLRNNDIKKTQVIEAAKAVGAHDFIMKLPENYNFDVKERGGMLSVGQRQLISFIRAYVYNPSILVLDEATSSIDNESEELIQKATETLTQGRTSIVIAHRLSTIRNASKIYVMDSGKIVEYGTHNELLALKGQYAKLHDLQFSSRQD